MPWAMAPIRALELPFITMGVSTIHPMRMATMPPREKRTSLVLKLVQHFGGVQLLKQQNGQQHLKAEARPHIHKMLVNDLHPHQYITQRTHHNRGMMVVKT